MLNWSPCTQHVEEKHEQRHNRQNEHVVSKKRFEEHEKSNQSKSRISKSRISKNASVKKIERPLFQNYKLFYFSVFVSNNSKLNE